MKRLCKLVSDNPENAAGITMLTAALVVMLIFGGLTIGWGQTTFAVVVGVTVVTSFVGGMFGLHRWFDNLKCKGEE